MYILPSSASHSFEAAAGADISRLWRQLACLWLTQWEGTIDAVDWCRTHILQTDLVHGPLMERHSLLGNLGWDSATGC